MTSYNNSYKGRNSRNDRNDFTQTGKSGLTVHVRDGQFERALRKFKKKVQEHGIIQEVRDRKAYVKPSEIKRKAKDAGKKRWYRKRKESEFQ
jgi:small subunit ribosomal protein S21